MCSFADLMDSITTAYLNLLLEFFDVVDSQIQHVRSVGLLQEMEGQVVDKSIMEWSSHSKFANSTVLLPIGERRLVQTTECAVPCPCLARVLAAFGFAR